MGNLSKFIEEAFSSKEKLTLKELCTMVENNPDLGIDPSVMKHRVRSSIWGLKKTNRIKRVGEGIYEKV